MRGGYDRVEGSIGKSYDEIKGVTMSMSRDFYMLGKITTGKTVEKLDMKNRHMNNVRLVQRVDIG